MSFVNVQDFLDLGGKSIVCQNVYAGFTKPDQLAYNTVLPAPIGGSGQSPGGTSGQVQYNASGAFGGLANSSLTALIIPFSSTLSGAVPASGGGTVNFLRADGNWAAPSNVSPGGISGNIQYNNNGTFGGLTSPQITTLIDNFTNTLSGTVPASNGGTTNFLRADGTWVAPPGTVTQRSATTSSAAQPLSTDIVINMNISSSTTISLPQASTRLGKQLTFVDAGLKAGTFNITLTPFSGDTIVNWTTPGSLVMSVNGQVVTIYPFNDGVNNGWFIA